MKIEELLEAIALNSASEQDQLAAVTLHGSVIRYIKSPSEAVQLAAVQQYGRAIKYIENPSEAVQLAAVNRNGFAIQFIKDPSEAVQLAAVKQNGSAIEYIENPSEAVQLAAVKEAKDLVFSEYNITSKDSVLIKLLTFIKSDRLKNQMILYYVLRHTYPEWPEWAAIEKSLRASKIIK